jgi:integrase/recombinase XerD
MCPGTDKSTTCRLLKREFGATALDSQERVKEHAMRQQLESFLQYLTVEKGHSDNTLVAYQNDLGQFLAALEAHVPPLENWGQVTKDTIVDYLGQLREKSYASSTIARKIAAIKSFCHFMVAEGILAENPATTIDSPKVKKRLPRTLTSDDVDRLLAAPARELGPKALRDAALLELLYATGMRVTELVTLKLDDVNLVAGHVRVRRGKGGKERIIPIHDKAVTALQEYIERGRPSLVKVHEQAEALFLNHRGQRLTRQGTWLIIKEYAQAAGIQTQVTPHMLRHSFATHMLESQKASLADVQHFLGHANISTTQIYTQVTSEHKRRVYDEAHPRAREPEPVKPQR